MASSAVAAIPPLNKIYIVSTWVETVLWGFNTLVFSVVCWVLFWRRPGQRNNAILFTTSLLLYICATLNVSAALRQQLEAFIYAPEGAPSYYASVYYATQSNPLAVLKTSTYVVAILIQDLVLTWRMYVVWGSRWQVVVIPLILELTRLGVALSGVIILAQPGADPDSTVLRALSSVSWPLELIVNISVTAAIASRLWYTGFRISKAMSQPSRTNTYIRHIFLLVESGALLLGTTIAMLVLYNLNNPAALCILDIATQIAALVAYLVIVRSGLGLTHGLPGSPPDKSVVTSYAVASTASGMVFRMDQLDAGGRIRSENGIQVTREVVTDSGKGTSVEDYKTDHGSHYAV